MEFRNVLFVCFSTNNSAFCVSMNSRHEFIFLNGRKGMFQKNTFVFPSVLQNGRHFVFLSFSLQIRRKAPSVFSTNKLFFPSVFSTNKTEGAFRYLYKSFRFFLPFFLQIQRKAPSVFERKVYPSLVRLTFSFF